MVLRGVWESWVGGWDELKGKGLVFLARVNVTVKWVFDSKPPR